MIDGVDAWIAASLPVLRQAHETLVDLDEAVSGLRGDRWSVQARQVSWFLRYEPQSLRPPMPTGHDGTPRQQAA